MTKDEQAAKDRIKEQLKTFLNSQPISLILEETNVIDGPEEFWAIARALGELSDEFAWLATK